VRADAERTAGVAPSDGAAAGADGVDVDHRQRERAAADLPRGRLAHAAALDHAHVTRRAAHVEAQQVGLAAARREQGRGRRAARGPAEHGQRRVVGRGVERGQAAA
jgi:hypothetical protein